MTFRWTVRLTKDGHRFKNGEWRCADCRRRVFDLLENRQSCMSPTVDGEYLFIGGPLDGEWQWASEAGIPKKLYVVIPPAVAELQSIEAGEEPTVEQITYTLKRRDDKPILAYVYDP